MSKRRTRAQWKTAKLDPATEAVIERQQLHEYHRHHIRGWYCDVMHIIGHLRREAEQMHDLAENEPAGSVAVMGAGQLANYVNGLDAAHAALGFMMPPACTDPPVLMNVVDLLDQLRREATREGGEG